ncbi:MAG TPA: ribosome maturation factor RimM [Nocardioidaceae bacterium]|nr:ribosome maturation factor RimM [Nocardioidaceae bacterium]
MEVLVGRVARAHGLRGEVAVEIRTDVPELRFAVGAVFGTDRGTLTVAATRWNSARLLIRFKEAADRESAERLRGTQLLVEIDADETPDDPDEFYDHQLIGLRALDAAGAEIGRVGAVLHLPAQDVLVVERDGREALVPFVSEHVPAVDVVAGSLTIADGSGLLEPLSDDETADAPEGA